MIRIRPADSIYHKEGGWFSANWHFSFAEYYDPENMGFGTMRVFNDDRLVPGAIWPMHPHRNVEGLTYVVEGTFRHQDSLGNGGVFPAGSVQRMTLGSGAYHSEQNGSETEPMRFIQVWIMPAERDLPPEVEQKQFTQADRTNRLLRAIGPDRDGGSILVHQDASMYISRLEPIMTLDIATPDEFFGDVLGDISSRRGLVADVDHSGDLRVITAHVPLSETFDYATTLDSISQGRASYTESHNSNSISHAFRPGFGGYIYVLKGTVTLNDAQLATGDAAMIADETTIEIAAQDTSELIMMEVQVG